MMKRPIVFLKEEVDVMMNEKERRKKEVHVIMNKMNRLMKEGEVHIMILNQAARPPIKGKNHTMKISRGRRLLRGF